MNVLPLKKRIVSSLITLLLPLMSQGQSIGDDTKGLHQILEQLYDEMMPLCSNLLAVGQGIAGFGALWYIASRVWRHIARAEPIDFYPLFRPFVLGFCILIFPSVLALLNGVLKPTLSATAAMVQGSNKAIEVLLIEKEKAIKETNPWKMYVGVTGTGDREQWYEYTHGEDAADEGMMASIGNNVRFAMEKASYNFRNSVKQWLSEVLQVLFQAAALCIDTLRTFQLVVLSVLGPLVFGIAVFDGFKQSLTLWLGRYITIYLWLPVANIFGSIIGKIQEQMLKLDIAQVNQSGDTFFSSTDIAYLIFMIIGIIGYFTVPSVANSIVHAAAEGALGQKVTSAFTNTTTTVLSGGSQTGAMALGAMGSAASSMYGGMSSSASSSGHSNDKGNPMSERLRGNSN
ncbi:conjugative transposon protein TraJ [Flavobacterium sp. JAS]|uniref:conjugative transposon protein TraJ n=1 Tax=Flavobacterium sp. JAS TaxID=2897329 RepID=UPI001E2EB5CE|nr:conjugative transposon protein TraJ [Flavobacterium sp. JAS]MCD0470601.1 conjugative transposon protein TraJ [Flavobacterium sp. JAS]